MGWFYADPYAEGCIAVLSHVVTDEVYDPAGVLVGREVGGAGAYAAVGASLVSPAWTTRLISGVGSIDLAAVQRWCAERDINADGLFVVDEHSPVTKISYLPDGEREEISLYGADHFAAHTPMPSRLHQPGPPPAGVYLFHGLEPAYWEDFAAVRPAYRGPVLWEVAADACRPESLAHVRDLARGVDVLSLNWSEATALLGADDFRSVQRRLGRQGLVLVVRRGHEGSVVVTRDGAWVIGVAATPVVDPTGGGNSYSGAFIAELARSGNPIAAGRAGAAAAGQVIAQVGAPTVDETARRHLRSSVASIPVSRYVA